jgi:hypothetical protein
LKIQSTSGQRTQQNREAAKAEQVHNKIVAVDRRRQAKSAEREQSAFVLFFSTDEFNHSKRPLQWQEKSVPGMKKKKTANNRIN